MAAAWGVRIVGWDCRGYLWATLAWRSWWREFLGAATWQCDGRPFCDSDRIFGVWDYQAVHGTTFRR